MYQAARRSSPTHMTRVFATSTADEVLLGGRCRDDGELGQRDHRSDVPEPVAHVRVHGGRGRTVQHRLDGEGYAVADLWWT
jgi:hypothetical protein